MKLIVPAYAVGTDGMNVMHGSRLYALLDLSTANAQKTVERIKRLNLVKETDPEAQTQLYGFPATAITFFLSYDGIGSVQDIETGMALNQIALERYPLQVASLDIPKGALIKVHNEKVIVGEDYGYWRGETVFGSAHLYTGLLFSDVLQKACAA